MMKSKMIKKQGGFTLVEVIAVLLLMGIVALALSTTLVAAVDGYLFAKDSADAAQKAQLALSRISRELLQATKISSANGTTLTYTTAAGTFQLVKNNDVITLEKTDNPVFSAKTLIDKIETNYGTDSFLTYEKPDGTAWSTEPSDEIENLYIIKLILKLQSITGGQLPAFETAVNPRENSWRNVPPFDSEGS